MTVDRLGLLHAVRVVIGISVAVVALTTAGVDQPFALVAVAAGWTVLTTAFEAGRRVGAFASIRVVQALVLSDAVVLAIGLDGTGHGSSPLLFAVYLHVTATTVLVSYRTGLKVAVWHSLLLFTTAALTLEGTRGAGDLDVGSIAIDAAGFLLVAAGVAASSAVNEHILHRGRDEVRALADLGVSLESASDTFDIASRLAGLLRYRLGFARVVVLTRRPGGWDGALATEESTGLVRSHAAVDELTAEVWSSRQPALRRRLGADAPFLDTVLPGATDVVVIPASSEHALVVAAEWPSRRVGGLRTQTLAAAVEATTHAGLAVYNARLEAEVARLATHDALTGLRNRRLFDDALEFSVARARRDGRPVSLVLLDIDHFKAVNDTFGHPIGDAVLAEAGAAVLAECRGMDVAARYGGEEFAVVLPDCPGPQAVQAAERIRNAINVGVRSVPVTVSAGVATFPRNADDPCELVNAADAALYDAKRSGRNRTARARLTERRLSLR